MSDDGAQLQLPTDRRAAGVYGLSFDVSSGLSGTTVTALRDVTMLLAVAGNRGAFPFSSPSSRGTRFEILSGRLEPPTRMLMEFDGAEFDLYGFELLRNMLDRLARKDIEVDRVAVWETRADRETRLKPAPADVTEYDSYPSLSPLVTFPVVREPLDDSRLRRCLIELRLPVEAWHLERTAECVSCWFQLLEAGAFSLPVGPAWETDCIGGSTTIFDERSIEVSVNRFQASECAWYALLNMLGTCWSAERLISTVTIE